MAKATKAAPKAKAKAEKVLPLCLCGCGGKTGSTKSRFRPGHDAKVHSLWISDPGSLPKTAQDFAREKGWERGTTDRGDKAGRARPKAKAKATRRPATTKPEASAPAVA
jgi:hypothetical protein